MMGHTVVFVAGQNAFNAQWWQHLRGRTADYYACVTKCYMLLLLSCSNAAKSSWQHGGLNARCCGRSGKLQLQQKPGDCLHMYMPYASALMRQDAITGRKLSSMVEFPMHRTLFMWQCLHVLSAGLKQTSATRPRSKRLNVLSGPSKQQQQP